MHTEGRALSFREGRWAKGEIRDEGGRRLLDVQVIVLVRGPLACILGRLELEVDQGLEAAAHAICCDVDADDLVLRDELDGPAVLGRVCSWWGAVR